MEYISKKKLLNDMAARMDNMKNMIERDHADQAQLYRQFWELKYWREAVERGTFDIEKDEEEFNARNK
jgi:hypothetical protein